MIPYAVFDPGLLDISESFSAKEHNLRVRESWDSLSNSSAISEWFNDMNGSIVQAMRALHPSNEEEELF